MSELGFKMSDDLVRLSSLLNPDKSDDDDDDMPDSSYASLGPGNIGSKSKKSTENVSTPYAKKADTNSDDIWNSEEVQEGSIFNQDDPRIAPQYDLVLKQKVTSEDMFLGMSGKNPSSACCEEMVIKIVLPDSKMSDVDLDIKADTLDCCTPKYRLLLPLPHPVDPKLGKAQWHPDKFTLEVTLVMRREYDYINFQ